MCQHQQSVDWRMEISDDFEFGDSTFAHQVTTATIFQSLEKLHVTQINLQTKYDEKLRKSASAH